MRLTERQGDADYSGASAYRFGSSSLAERAQGTVFVGLDFEDLIEFRNLQQVVDVCAWINELEPAAAVANGSMAAHKFAEPSAVYEFDAFQIQHDAIVSALEKIVNRCAKQASSFREGDLADDIGNYGAMRLAQTDSAFRGGGSFHT